MGKEHNIRRTTWVFTFMVVVSVQTYTKYLHTLYMENQNPIPTPKNPKITKNKTKKPKSLQRIWNIIGTKGHPSWIFNEH